MSVMAIFHQLTTRSGQDSPHRPRQARWDGEQRSVAGHYRGAPPESAAGVSQHALDSGVREEGCTLAGPPGRREGFRRGRATRVRPCPRGRSSNREGTSAARLEIGDQAGGKIPEADKTPQGPPRSRGAPDLFGRTADVQSAVRTARKSHCKRQGSATHSESFLGRTLLELQKRHVTALFLPPRRIQ